MEQEQVMATAVPTSHQPAPPNLMQGLGAGVVSDTAVLQRVANGRLSRAGHSLLQLQRSRGNRYVQRMVMQARLRLGPTHDPYEQEAESLAQQVVHRRQGGLVRQRVVAEGGTAVAPAVESAISRAKSGGRPLPGRLQHQMGQAFNADFRHVRVHTDSQADQLNQSLQATAFTIGPHIFFRQGEYSPTSAAGQELLAHELTHVVQQNSAAVQHNSATIRRHSSFEHRMLGDVDPTDLEILGAKGNLNKMGKAVGLNSSLTVSAGPLKGKQISKEHVLHVLYQEIARLEYMRDHGPQKFETQEEVAARINEKFDNKWQVKLVTIPNDSTIDPFYPPLVVTYGELNTLADIYGSIEEMKKTDPENRWQIVQGIRQQSLFLFYDMVNEIKENKLDEFSGKTGRRTGFEGAVGSTGRVGERGKLGQRELTKEKFAADHAEDYKATLARNACHFAPESWHTWADYHQKARDLAQTAVNIAAKSKDGWKDKAAQDKMNEAWLTNGFGDHFLQDSYASGHLINKTQIMMWLVKWIDVKDKKHGATDEEWRQIRVIAANQTDLNIDDDRYDLANVGKLPPNDMQFAENLKGHWLDRFGALGLRLPASVRPDPESDSWQFLAEWQLYAAQKGTRELPPTLLAKLKNDTGWDDLIHQLVADNVVQIMNIKGNPAIDPLKHSHKGTWKYYRLHPDYVPRDANEFAQMMADIQGPDVLDPSLLTEESKREIELKRLNAQDVYGRRAAAITYQGFHNFMRNARLQYATNVLHNKFCVEGLLVKTGEGTDIGRIYGDNAMLNANSGKGVKYSAETAHMSMQAIQDILNGQQPVSLTAISNRFPAQVEVKGQYVSLAEWNKGLKKVCEDGGIFEDATSGIGGVYTEKFNLGDKISKDDINQIHKGEAF
jgi:hypothetical protein